MPERIYKTPRQDAKILFRLPDLGFEERGACSGFHRWKRFEVHGEKKVERVYIYYNRIMEQKKLLYQVGSPRKDKAPVLKQNGLGWKIAAGGSTPVCDDRSDTVDSENWDTETSESTDVLIFY